MNKVTPKIKNVILDLKKKGFTNKRIGEILCFAPSTIAYHSKESNKKKAISRAIKNQKPRDRKEYMKNYQTNRYKNDEKFRERTKEANRDNWRKKNGTK